MSALSVFIDLSSVSVLIYENAENYEFVTYPYVYSPNIFSNYTTKGAFYGNLLERLCKQKGLTVDSCDVYLVGIAEDVSLMVNNVPIKVRSTLSLPEVLQKVLSHYPIHINTYSIATPREFLSRVESGRVSDTCRSPVAKSEKGEGIDLHANLSIYPQMQNLDLNSQVELDETILANSGVLTVPKDASLPITFMGSRFCCGQVRELDYILIFSLLRDLGVYEIQIDRSNALVLTSALGAEIPLAIEDVGTYVNLGGAAECMFTTTEGKPQLLDLAKDTLHIVPLGNTETAHISVKSSVGTFEGSVKGGTLGITFDTVENKGSLYSDVRLFNKALKAVGETLKSF